MPFPGSPDYFFKLKMFQPSPVEPSVPAVVRSHMTDAGT